jgi:hypothetical protein
MAVANLHAVSDSCVGDSCKRTWGCCYTLGTTLLSCTYYPFHGTISCCSFKYKKLEEGACETKSKMWGCCMAIAWHVCVQHVSNDA